MCCCFFFLSCAFASGASFPRRLIFPSSASAFCFCYFFCFPVLGFRAWLVFLPDRGTPAEPRHKISERVCYFADCSLVPRVVLCVPRFESFRCRPARPYSILFSLLPPCFPLLPRCWVLVGPGLVLFSEILRRIFVLRSPSSQRPSRGTCHFHTVLIRCILCSVSLAPSHLSIRQINNRFPWLTSFTTASSLLFLLRMGDPPCSTILPLPLHPVLHLLLRSVFFVRAPSPPRILLSHVPRSKGFPP